MPEPLHIRPQTPDDDERVLEIEHGIFESLVPPRTVEEYRHDVSTLPADAGRTAVVAEREGRIVGSAVWHRSFYVVNPDAYSLSLAVDPPQQGRGVGSMLYEFALTDIRPREAKSVRGRAREDDSRSLAFAARRGFEASGHGERYSRLDVQQAHLEAPAGAGERLQAAGISITPLADPDPPDKMLREIWLLEKRTSRDMPGSLDWEGLPFHTWQQLVLRGPRASWDAIWIALNGTRSVGLANLQLRAGHTAVNGYTGVHAGNRGRGIARGLKLRAVEWAREQGIRYIYTGNDVENRPMLAINRELGYEPLAALLDLALLLPDG